MNETGLRSGNDLDLEYSHTFIDTISCLFRSQTAKISEKYIVFIFIPPVYKVYRGYIVFAFSVRMFVCLSVNFFFRQRFLRNYLTKDFGIWYKHPV